MSDESLSKEEAILQKRATRELAQLGWEETTKLTAMEVVSAEPRKVVLQLHVTHSTTNLRNFAHGGYLFTLCDMASGCLVYANQLDCVTLNSSVNYLRGVQPGDDLTITAQSTHWGHSTIVNDVTITNQKGTPVVHATVTMYVLGELKNES